MEDGTLITKPPPGAPVPEKLTGGRWNFNNQKEVPLGTTVPREVTGEAAIPGGAISKDTFIHLSPITPSAFYPPRTIHLVLTRFRFLLECPDGQWHHPLSVTENC